MVARWRGILVKIFYYDHPPPHVNVWYSGDKARIYIRILELFDGYLPLKIRRRVEQWLKQCQEEILYRWDLASVGVPGAAPLTEDCEDEA